MKKTIKTGLIFISALILTSFLSHHPSRKKKPDPYLFAYFTGDGGSGLHMAWSENGLLWTPLKGGKSFVRPGVGEYVMRDPHLSQTPDGVYHLVWATGVNRKDIGYAWSKNLVDWSAQRLIPVMEKDSLVLNTWSPELVYDGDQSRFMLIWASTVPGKFRETDKQNDSLPDGYRYNHRIYRKLSQDLREWGPTELFFEPGFSVTDPHVVTDSGQIMLFYKDATQIGKNIQNNIKMGKGPSPTGSFSTNPVLISRRTWAEAPMTARIDTHFVVYFHKYRNKKMGAVRTRDFKKWKDISDTLSFPKGALHGSIIRIPEKTLEKLKEI